jgi:hypothetical protein
MKIIILYLIVLFVFSLSGCSENKEKKKAYINTANFEKIYEHLSMPLSKRKVVFKSKYDDNDFDNNQLAGNKLNDSYNNDFEYSFYKNKAYNLGIRLFISSNGKLMMISSYQDDGTDKEGLLSDYYLFKSKYGEPVINIRKPEERKSYLIFDTAKAFLMLGEYLHDDYFVVLINKSLATTQNILIHNNNIVFDEYEISPDSN